MKLLPGAKVSGRAVIPAMGQRRGAVRCSEHGSSTGALGIVCLPSNASSPYMYQMTLGKSLFFMPQAQHL